MKITRIEKVTRDFRVGPLTAKESASTSQPGSIGTLSAADCLADGGEKGALMRSNNANACLRLLVAAPVFQGEVIEAPSDIINDANRLLCGRQR
jgi:hypothetical protein